MLPLLQGGARPKTGIFSVNWHRVVLDEVRAAGCAPTAPCPVPPCAAAWRMEAVRALLVGVCGVHCAHAIIAQAHDIRNRQTHFEAVMALRTGLRWCLTGTPIINKADDAQVAVRAHAVAP